MTTNKTFVPVVTENVIDTAKETTCLALTKRPITIAETDGSLSVKNAPSIGFDGVKRSSRNSDDRLPKANYLESAEYGSESHLRVEWRYWELNRGSLKSPHVGEVQLGEI